MLCSCCDDLTIEKLLELHTLHLDDENYLWEDFPREAFYTHHSSFQSLTISAEGGCELCQVIFDAFAAERDCMDEINARIEMDLDTTVCIHIALNRRESDTPEQQIFDRLFVKAGFDDCERNWDDEDELSTETSNLSGDSDSEQSQEVDLSGPEYPWPGRRTVLLSLSRSQHTSAHLEKIRVGEPYRGNGLQSVENFNIAREWLRTCVSGHPEESCPKLHNRPFPTRIIDIGSPDRFEIPRLIVSSGRHGLYVALSHCWGGEQPLKTTLESLETYCISLPMGSIPKTFCDAMRITGELGFRYLWIDSLCIVQDSCRDWERESAVMDDVYRNAVLTIAASASKNCEVGMFDLQPTEQCNIYSPLKLRPDSSSDEYVQVCAFKGEEDLMDPLFRLPLARRGWALQERILSQRVLHYGERRIYWQCRLAHFSADGNPPDDHAVLEDALGALLKVPRFVENRDESPQLQALNDRWLKIVESYNRYRQLTFESDKLPAISGIASTFQKLTGDEYIAGIWKNDWPRGVLWQTWPYTKKIQDRAPSWSWAGWDGYMAFEMHSYQTIDNHLLAKLCQHHIQLTGHNHLGEVRSGSLRLRGWVIVKNLDQISRLGELRLDEYSVNPHHKNMKNIIGASAYVEYTVMIIRLFLSHTNHEIPLEIWKRGMLLLKRVGEDDFQTYERVGAVFHRLDTHGDFDMAGWTLHEVTII